MSSSSTYTTLAEVSGAAAGVSLALTHPEVLEMILSVVILMMVAIIVYNSAFLLSHTYPYVIIGGILLLLVSGLVTWRESRKSSLLYYWNMIYGALLLLGAVLVSHSDSLWEQTGSAIFVVAAVVDIGVHVYCHSKREAMKEDEKRMNPIVPLLVRAAADLLIAGSFGWALWKSL